MVETVVNKGTHANFHWEEAAGQLQHQLIIPLGA